MDKKSITLFIATVSITTILGSTEAQANLIDPVMVGDREWRQLDDTYWLVYYDELASIYDTSTGNLSGSTTTIGNIDFTGWTWASLDDVFNLYEQIPGHNITPEINPDWQNGGEANSTLGDFFENNFESTDGHDDSPSYSYLEWIGLTRDNKSTGVERHYFWSQDGNTLLRSQDMINYDNDTTESGAWLYREVNPVPIPSAVWLFGSGLIGLIGLARRKA